MKRISIAAGLLALLLVAATGCGASSGSHRSSSDYRSRYGYGEMFAASGADDGAGSYGGGGGGSYSTTTAMPASGPPSAPMDMEEAIDEMSMDSEPEPVMAMERAAVSPGSSGGSTGLGGAGGYMFEDDMVEGDMVRPDGAMAMAGGEAAPAPPPAPPRSEPTRVAEASTPAPTPAGGEAAGGGEAGAEQVADAGSGGPLLIYTADLNLAVHEVREKMEQVIAVADDVGGYLQSQDDTTLIIRVPARHFRQSLERVEGVGDVLSRRVSTQDVSEQFRDIRIRLRNALQMRDQMAELLERADTVPDSLTIQRELERLTTEIELYRGQLRSLEHRIAFSTITVRFQPIRVDAEVPRERFRLPFPWLDRLGLPHLMELR